VVRCDRIRQTINVDDMKTRTERLQFQGALGDVLAARLERPEEPVAYALFAHCFTCTKDLKPVTRISRHLAENGIAVLRFDFTGLGESEGDFADTNFSSNLDDLVAAADFLREEFEPVRLLVGHSLGGAAVLAAAHRVPECRAVATIAAPSSTGHLHDRLRKKTPDIQPEEPIGIELAGRTIHIRKQLLDDLQEHKLTDAINSLDRPLMIFHSPIDKEVGIEHARKIYEAAQHPKSFIALDQADHLLLSDERDARFIGEVLAAWAARYFVET